MDPLETMLIDAVQAGNLSLLEECLRQGVDIDRPRGAFHYPPIHMAAQRGLVETVEFLLDHKAKVDACNRNGFTALHWYSSIAPCIVVTDQADRRRAMLRACWKGHVEVVKLLLHHRAQVNAQTSDGMTPLYWAAKYNHQQIAIILFQNGADKTIRVRGLAPTQMHESLVGSLMDAAR